MMEADRIMIHDLELISRIGISPGERAEAQKLRVTVGIEADLRKAAATDDLAHTVDYAVLAASIRRLAAEGERRLLETLAEEIAAHVLQHEPVRGVTVDLRKFVVPDTASVGVRIRRP